jgi:hypothetical protein
MKNEVQQNSISPDGKYTLLFGEVLEYSMGGAYACTVYLHQLGENVRTLHTMCANRPMWNDDSTAVYFSVWYSNEVVRLRQRIAKYDLLTKKVSIYGKDFAVAEIRKLENDILTVVDYLQSPAPFNVNTEKIIIDEYAKESE